MAETLGQRLYRYYLEELARNYSCVGCPWNDLEPSDRASWEISAAKIHAEGEDSCRCGE